MNFFRAAVVAFIIGATALPSRAAEVPRLKFDQKALALPPLSLREIVPSSVPVPSLSLQGETKRPPLPSPSSVRREGSELSSRWPMPLLRPDETIDYKVIVVPPDPAVDFKLAIKNPDRDAPQRNR